MVDHAAIAVQPEGTLRIINYQGTRSLAYMNKNHASKKHSSMYVIFYFSLFTINIVFIANESYAAEAKTAISNKPCTEDLVDGIKRLDVDSNNKLYINYISNNFGGQFMSVKDDLAKYQHLNTSSYTWSSSTTIKPAQTNILYVTSNDETRASFDTTYGVPVYIMQISNWDSLCKESFSEASSGLQSIMKADVSKTTLHSNTFFTATKNNSTFSATITSSKNGTVWLIKLITWHRR